MKNKVTTHQNKEERIEKIELGVISFEYREGGRNNERPGTDHVISGPMRA